MHTVGNSPIKRTAFTVLLCTALFVVLMGVLCACTDDTASLESDEETFEVNDTPYEGDDAQSDEAVNDDKTTDEDGKNAQKDASVNADELRDQLSLTEDYRDSFVHGDKPAEYQKYIVLHDTEGGGTGSDIVDYWDGNGEGVAAHFIINKDGSIVQCVNMDAIAHHAGFGDAGHNEQFGVEDESRDDKVGTESIGDSYPDYGMNSYSIGIEMVHSSSEDSDYPEAQLDALDNLIAYIDAYYGFESEIIDHKTWRTSNSDTSAEFSDYLKSYQTTRKHA